MSNTLRVSEETLEEYVEATTPKAYPFIRKVFTAMLKALYLSDKFTESYSFLENFQNYFAPATNFETFSDLFSQYTDIKYNKAKIASMYGKTKKTLEIIAKAPFPSSYASVTFVYGTSFSKDIIEFTDFGDFTDTGASTDFFGSAVPSVMVRVSYDPGDLDAVKASILEHLNYFAALYPARVGILLIPTLRLTFGTAVVPSAGITLVTNNFSMLKSFYDSNGMDATKAEISQIQWNGDDLVFASEAFSLLESLSFFLEKPDLPVNIKVLGSSLGLILEFNVLPEFVYKLASNGFYGIQIHFDLS